MFMKKFATTALAVTMALSLAACTNETPVESSAPTETVETGRPSGPVGGVQVVNPFQDFATLEEAEALTGYELTLPEYAAEEVHYRAATDKSMLEIIFVTGEDELRIRKGPGEEDLSGIYETFETTQEVDLVGRTVTLSGEGEDVYHAMWLENGYSFFVRSTQPMTQAEMTALLGQIG